MSRLSSSSLLLKDTHTYEKDLMRRKEEKQDEFKRDIKILFTQSTIKPKFLASF